MTALARTTNPAIPEDYIERYHLRHSDPVFHILVQEGEMRAFQAASCFMVRGPHGRRESPAVYIHLSYKQPAPNPMARNFFAESFARFLRDELGRNWKWRRFWVIAQTTNPRVYERGVALYPTMYPSMDQPLDPAIQKFAQRFLRENLKVEYHFLDEYLTHQLHDDPMQRWSINEVWDHMYAARSAAVNDFFLDRGVIERDAKGRYYWAGKGILCLGRYSLGGVLKRRLLGGQ